jgi:hypothetical protein
MAERHTLSIIIDAKIFSGDIVFSIGANLFFGGFTLFVFMMKKKLELIQVPKKYLISIPPNCAG